MRLSFGETEEPLRAFWQARFYDFNVYSHGKKTEKLNYMHANPVIRGLVKHPRDWAWSSWGFYYGEAMDCWRSMRTSDETEEPQEMASQHQEENCNPKTQVQKANLGHPPCSLRSELKINGSYFRASTNLKKEKTAIRKRTATPRPRFEKRTWGTLRALSGLS